MGESRGSFWATFKFFALFYQSTASWLKVIDLGACWDQDLDQGLTNTAEEQWKKKSEDLSDCDNKFLPWSKLWTGVMDTSSAPALAPAANQRPVFRSRDHYWPIRGQCSQFPVMGNLFWGGSISNWIVNYAGSVHIKWHYPLRVCCLYVICHFSE